MAADSSEPGNVAPAPRISLRKVLGSESFVEKAALLLLTALITGMLVPLAIGWINANETRRQQAVNEARTRNDALVAAQSRLLDEFTETISTIQTLALDVSWHGIPDVANPEMQKRAYERYSDQIIGHIARWRAEVAKARILASPQVAEKMYRHFADMFDQDLEIVKLMNRHADAAEWNARHSKSEEFLVKGEALLGELARDMGLSRPAPRAEK